MASMKFRTFDGKFKKETIIYMSIRFDAVSTAAVDNLEWFISAKQQVKSQPLQKNSKKYLSKTTCKKLRCKTWNKKR